MEEHNTTSMDEENTETFTSPIEIDGEKSLDETGDGVETEIQVPTIGMTFAHVDDMFNYYSKYGKQKGFPVCRRTSKKGENGEVKYVTFECGRAGKSRSKSVNILKPYPNMKIGCEAKLGGCLGADGLWRINFFKDNHEHSVSPGKSRFFRCNRRLSSYVKRRLDVNDRAAIKMSKNFDSLVAEAGGLENLSFTERDCRNYIEKARRLRLGEGDAIAVQSYFLKMQSHSSDFFFSIDLDEEGRLRNVFWADSRSRAAYKEYGRAVTFDTTYLTNKYDMPFAPFVGVNHHGQSTLLGCGLVSSEDTKSFVWLFQTWLACMSGCAPHRIITDQDRAMRSAIEIVFPNTRHRWCLWHIMKKFSEKLGRYKDYSSIVYFMQCAVYDSQIPEEYEETWNKMIEKFNLYENKWLNELFKERHRWVPCFVKDSFWAGMSTTQRSESMNSFFDDYVNAKTSLKQFVEQYGNALADKIELEKQEDFISNFKQIPCVTTYEIEKQVQEAYTLEKFKEFQVELVGKMYCEFMSISEDSVVYEYDVREDILVGEAKRRVSFKVTFERDKSHVRCSCRRYEFRVMLCRHALAVLLRNDVRNLPEEYIRKQWRKDIRRCHSRVNIYYDVASLSTEQIRFEKMSKILTEVADLAAEDQEECEDVLNWANEKVKRLSKKNTKVSGGGTSQENSQIILDPIPTRGKGRPLQRGRSRVSPRNNAKRRIM